MLNILEKQKKGIEIIAFLSVVFLTALGLIVRTNAVSGALDSYTDCSGCYRLLVIQYDAWVVVLIMALLGISYWSKWRLLALCSRLLVLLVLAFYWLDIYIFLTLNHRLTVEDIGIYGDFDTLVSFLKQPMTWWMVLVAVATLVLIGLWLGVIFFQKEVSVCFKRISVATLLCSILLFGSYAKNTYYLLPEYVHNYIYNLFFLGERSSYSEDYIKHKQADIPKYEKQTCYSDGLNQQKNIILVIFESLSAYHSKLFSGVNDWTPYLDKLAKENLYYTNFFANSYASLYGRVALLTGEIPLFPHPLTVTDYRDTRFSVPRDLALSGYHSAALVGSDLAFLGAGKFFNALDFDYVEGPEYEGYKGVPRFGFSSVSDEVLYRRTLDYIKAQQSPYFLTLITVSSHAPYVHPKTKEKSIEKAIRYADKALFDFYRELEKSQFFNNGVLLITSDHRAMVPIQKREKMLLGEMAKSKIPLVIIDGQRKGENTHYFQQADIPSSLNYLTKSTYCLRKQENNLFELHPDKDRENCVYHIDGQSRNRVEIYCNDGKQKGVVRLSGDKTFYETGNLENPPAYVDWINTSRIDAVLRGRQYVKEHGAEKYKK